MADVNVLATIEMVQGQIRDLEAQLNLKRKMVNNLCVLIDREPMYSDTDSGGTVVTSIRTDEFYGQPLARVVRSVLEKRKAANLGAATVPEIYEAMHRGGFHFTTKNVENAKRGLYISLAKNTTTFHKLPNGTYGLNEWYPAVKEAKTKESNGKGKAEEKPLHEELQEEADAEDFGEAAEPTVSPK